MSREDAEDAEVTLLMNSAGQILSIYAKRADAVAKRNKFNADPWIDADTPDPGAPYKIETWCVQ